MDEKSSREAAISAKIAAIRAANEERERRHAEGVYFLEVRFLAEIGEILSEISKNILVSTNKF